ncbi:MAG TPA: hypothetical protein DIT65_06210 [Cryomorphaceae bacterium]|nr:hypothetical protein [Cryomorphaceae bacterium]|tara:strand:- start:2464 stop:2973 length:510 start_codon:yes stop_codon:yes gene_type:complete
MKITLFVFLGLISCAAPVSEIRETQEAVAVSDSASYYFELIDRGIATSGELEFATKHFIAEDSLVLSNPKLLMQAGLVIMSDGTDYLYGVNYLITLTKKYPEHQFAPEALMQLALFFENRFNDKEHSRNYLRALLDRYPQHKLAEQAEALLLLGSEEELKTIQNWLNKQ